MNIENISIGDTYADDLTGDIVKIIEKRQCRYAPPVLIFENVFTGEQDELGSYAFSKQFRTLEPKHYFIAYAHSKGVSSCVYSTTDGDLEQELFEAKIKKDKGFDTVVITFFKELTYNEKQKFLLSRKGGTK